MSQLSKTELDEVNNLRTKLAMAVSEAGQLTLQIQLMESDILELKTKLSEQAKVFKGLLEEEQKLVNRLSKQYGTDSINFETGEITPEK